MSQDSSEMKPCPLCGPEGEPDPEGWASSDDKGPSCSKCGMSTETIEDWNRLPQPHPAHSEREAEIRGAHWALIESVNSAVMPLHINGNFQERAAAIVASHHSPPEHKEQL